MAEFQIAIFPLLILVAIILEVVVYWKTKSVIKAAYMAEIILALFTFAFIAMTADMPSSDLPVNTNNIKIGLLWCAGFLSFGLLINGIVSLAKK
jgi:hypothetical protein